MGYLEDTPIVSTEAEADALLSKIESPTDGFQATKVVNEGEALQTPETVEPKVEPKAEVQKAVEEMFKLNWKGKEVERPRSEMIKLAQMGYDYNQKMSQLNQDRATVESQKTKWADTEKRLSEYKKLEDYIAKDPEWWKHVRENYSKRMQETGQAPTDPIVKKLSEELESMKGWVSSQQERDKQALLLKEDTDLDMEIREFRDGHPEFDWSTLDENGHDLERRIGKFALDRNIKNFNDAAKVFMFDEIVKRHEVKAKETLGKEIQKVTKLGLGEVRTTPKQKIATAQNIRSKSYDELAAEGIQEVYGR